MAGTVCLDQNFLERDHVVGQDGAVRRRKDLTLGADKTELLLYLQEDVGRGGRSREARRGEARRGEMAKRNGEAKRRGEIDVGYLVVDVVEQRSDRTRHGDAQGEPKRQDSP